MQPLPVGKGCPGMQRLADLAFAVPKERRNQAHDAATGDRSDPDSSVRDSPKTLAGLSCKTLEIHLSRSSTCIVWPGDLCLVQNH